MKTLPNTPSARRSACTALELRKRQVQVSVIECAEQDLLQLLQNEWREHLVRACIEILADSSAEQLQ